MNKSKSIKRKHKMRTLRRRSARQFRGGAAATDIISFITRSGDNKIVTTIIIAALFSGIYKQNATFMFKIAIEHILNELTRDNLEYFRRLINAPPEVVVNALAYAHHKSPYTPAVEPAVEIGGGSRRKTKHRLHLRRKSHKYKLQSGGDRNSAIIAAMLFLFIMSCWFLFNVLTDIIAPQLSNTLKDIPVYIKERIPNISFSEFSDSGLDADYKKTILNIIEAMNILIAQLNIGFPTNMTMGQTLTAAYTGLPFKDIQTHFVRTVNESLTTEPCKTAINQIGSGLHNLSDIANKHHYMPSVWTLGVWSDPIFGSIQEERDMLTNGWTLGTLKNILEKIIPEELASQFNKRNTDSAQHIILSSLVALVSSAVMIGKFTKSMRSRRSRRSKSFDDPSPSSHTPRPPLHQPLHQDEKATLFVPAHGYNSRRLVSSQFFNVEAKRGNGSYALTKPVPSLNWIDPPPYIQKDELELALDAALAAMDKSMGK